ncbi:hypothetical protein PCANC_08369 [Puccinia coronata f. sp. avenae]|uniref:C2H2-type domain-containing protein n=1 Tax=Puccinia coronata f. sp. avenae TaxID=200324 RepID=A0A2N5V6J6_9BASI|nr:hypothetical protein PCASD_11624 [Puccinia coronata f. sp. avenae]PLW45617.1 hypothetical protein PCANC_08369 [Puccinia coronata f. sp. avenae]
MNFFQQQQQQQQQQQYYNYQQQQHTSYQQPSSLLASVNHAIQNYQQSTHLQPQAQVQGQPYPYHPYQQHPYQYLQPYPLPQPYYPYPAAGPPTTALGYSLSPTAYSTQQQRPYTPLTNNLPPHHAQHEASQHQNKRQKTAHSRVEKFRCEECKQEYYNLTDLSVHLRNHVKCDYENCQFEALEHILDLHREDRHLIFKPGRSPVSKSKSNPKPDGPLNATIQGLGYALKTQEQIDSWIQERKKKWPSTAVVAQKRAQAEERKKQILQRVADDYKNNPQKRRHVWVRNDQMNQSETSSSASRAAPQEPTRPTEAAHEQHPQEEGNESSSSGSDMDPIKDSVSSKVAPPPPAPLATQPSSSMNPGQAEDTSRSRRPDQPTRPDPKHKGKGPTSNRRPGPPSSSSHLFLDRSGLFSKLIEKDVEQDVSDIHDVMQFLTRNAFLEGFNRDIDHPLHPTPHIEEVLE